MWTEFGALSPVKGSDLVDDDTARQATVAVHAAYAAAVQLVAPRVHARVMTLTAAGGTGDQFITDAEWAKIASDHVEDVIGDSMLDGVVAAATQFNVLAAPASIAKAFLSAANSFLGFVSQLRGQLSTWVENRIGQGIEGDWGIGQVVDELTKASPLSPDKADLLVASQLQASTNAGLFAGLESAQVAAYRWVTRRDERVRPAHAAVDTDTIPQGTQFNVGGYLCDYPGDPALPFSLRVNCRCELAYVDGTEARRIIGSTKAELRVKAAAMSIDGRSTMNKGELQGAVLKSLCLQGLAGGPDCPDVFDQMNRGTLLAHARGEGITGRYRMSREQLVTNLRQTMRGGDTALVSRGYAPRAEFTNAQKLAAYKRGRAGELGEFAVGATPPPAARRASRDAVFDEFGGPAHGSVPCVHCGLRLSAEPTIGMATLVPEPIIPWSNGGTLELSNLVPSCPACFRIRGGRGLVSSGAEFGFEEVPRDADGQWTSGPAGGMTATQFGKLIPAKRSTAPADWFAPAAEFKATKKLVAKKARDVPEPTEEKLAKNLAALEKAKTSGRAGGELRGNSKTRRARGEALFEEFGGGKNGRTYCPCGHCGLKVSPGGRDGHALMQQDKILVASEGGSYGTPTSFPNLIPSCGGCNASRNDAPLKTRPKWERGGKTPTRRIPGRSGRGLAASAAEHLEVVISNYRTGDDGIELLGQHSVADFILPAAVSIDDIAQALVGLSVEIELGNVNFASFDELVAVLDSFGIEANLHDDVSDFEFGSDMQPAGEFPLTLRGTFPTAEFAVDPSGSLTASVSGWCRAFPLGWDDPDVDTIGTPIEGYLAHRTVDVDWGSYEQWLVGAEVVDQATIERIGEVDPDAG